MEQIKQNIENILRDNQTHNFTLVAVSKTKPISNIELAYRTGQRDFGENKVQEMVDKHDNLPKDIKWHMIGHLQRNKVKFIAPFVYLIHGVDTEKLLIQIDKEGEKINRKIPCLLQIHIASEETKFGFEENEINQLIENETLNNLKFVEIKGLMGMATNTDQLTIVKNEFTNLKKLYNRLQPLLKLDTLSMGMSGDYELALEEGSNMIRVGSAIFGKRNYV